MIDTHAHLSDALFENEVAEVVERARRAGVTLIINPTVNLKDARKMLELTRQFREIYGLVGIYPGEAGQGEDWKDELVQLRELLVANEKVVGIGEIGLDRESYALEPEREELVFRAQFETAIELDYPVVIHTRDTQEDIGRILRDYPRLPRGHFHCFSGSEAWLEEVLACGFYVGFDGNVTYKAAENLRQLARRVPQNRLLLETDSPYLPPEGKRGERNESANVKITAEFLAKIRGESVEDLIVQTTRNAQNLFRLSGEI